MTSQLPNVARTWCVLCILTSKLFRATTACNFSSLIWPAGSAPAALASPPEPQIIGKNTVFRDFPTVSRICIFFLLIFSLLTLFTSAFQLSILSEVSLLNFLRLRKIISADPCCGGERVREATFVKQFEKTCWVTVVSCFKLFSVHPKRRQALVKGMECNGTGPRHRCDQPPVFLFGSEGTVRHWLHLETGPVRPSLVGGLSAAALVEDSLGTSPRALGNFFFVRFRR